MAESLTLPGSMYDQPVVGWGGRDILLKLLDMLVITSFTNGYTKLVIN